MNQNPKRPRRWLYPAGVERDYARRLVGIAEQLVGTIGPAVLQALGVREDAADPSIAPGWYDGLSQALEAATTLSPVQDQIIGPLVQEFAQRTVAFNRRQFHEVLRSAYGVNVLVTDPPLRQALQVWEAENLRLIKSIPEQYVQQLQGRVVAAVQNGTSLRDMTKIVRETYDLPRNRAELIARDQIGKLNAEVTQARQQAIGVEEYLWRGLRDGRERQEHLAREGKKYRWDQPPPDGHPGMPIRCRCSPEAVLPDLDDLAALIVH